MRRIISLTLAALLIFMQTALVCSGESDHDKIVITTSEQLADLAGKCSYDSFSKGLTVELGNDIDLNGSEFSGIPYFCGTFDGCGHTVKHMSLTREGSAVGFFRYTSKDARIKNLKVEGTVEPKGSATIVGGIVGENSGVLSGCCYSGTVKAVESAGGIVGKNTGVVSSCTFSGSVSAEHRAGGIAGESSGTVSGCTNSGKIDTTLISVSDKKTEISFNFDVSDLTEDDFLDITDIGGIAGWSTGVISTCTNEGSVGYERIGYNVGGIVGRQNGRVTGCTNKGAVIGRKDVGGIVGQAEPYAAWDISESTLREFNDRLSDIKKGVNTFVNSADNKSSNVKAAAKNLGSYVDEAARDTETALNTAAGNVSQAQSAANDLISLIINAINNNDPASAKKLVGDLVELVKKSPDGIDVSKLTELLERLRAEDSDHDLTISIKGDLKKAKDTNSTRDQAIGGGSAARSSSGRTVDELTSDIETAIDSKDLKLARELVDELLSLIESGAESVDLDAIDRIIKKLSELEGSYLGNAEQLSGSVESIITSVSFTHPDIYKLRSDADNIVSSAGQLRSLLTDGALKGSAKELIDSCLSLADLFADSDVDVLKLEKDHQTDISSLDSEKYSSGVITSCKNYGDISAETNVGGIAGNAACEVDIDAEDQLKLPAYLLQNARFVVFSVISECSSSSDVSAKKECCAGIVGNADFGAVKGCESSGSMHGGDYCGGIAGKSLGTISGSYSRCLLYGERYVGGVAGEGCDISNCRSYSYVKSEKECSGSVAGNATGTVEGCVFVENDLGGLDGISYAGIAEPVSYSEMMRLPGVPDWFKKITVTFVSGGNTVSVKEVEFGGSIEKLPEVKMDGTRYWKWNDFDNAHIYYSQTVEGEYKDPKTTISTDEEIPLFLAEGNFYEGQELTATPETSDIAIEGERGNLLSAYTLSVNGGEDILRIRMKMSDRGTLYMLSDGKWVEIDYNTDGSYIVFDMENGGTIAFFSDLRANIPKWAVATAAAALTVLILAVVIRSKKKKSEKTKVSKENAEDKEKEKVKPKNKQEKKRKSKA